MLILEDYAEFWIVLMAENNFCNVANISPICTTQQEHDDCQKTTSRLLWLKMDHC